MPKYISYEKLRKILEILGSEYLGLTKSGEVRVKYDGKEFSIGRKKKFGSKEGYEPESIKVLIQKISLEEAKKRKTSFGGIYHELRERLREVYSF